MNSSQWQQGMAMAARQEQPISR